MPVINKYVSEDKNPTKLFMADMLQFGMGIKKDDKKAYEIFSKLAGKGNIYAQFMSVQNHFASKEYKTLEELLQTGLDYYYGEHGKKRDYAMALTYFQQAAEKGYTEAQWRLGYIYKFGYGTTVDLKKAHYWIEKAAAQGNEDAISALKNRKW